MHQVVPLLPAALALLSFPVFAADSGPADAAAQEPKEAEVQRLYRERIEWINQGSIKFLGEQGARKVLIRFDGLKKTGCESPEKGVYRLRRPGGLCRRVSANRHSPSHPHPGQGGGRLAPEIRFLFSRRSAVSSRGSGRYREK